MIGNCISLTHLGLASNRLSLKSDKMEVISFLSPKRANTGHLMISPSNVLRDLGVQTIQPLIVMEISYLVLDYYRDAMYANTNGLHHLQMLINTAAHVVSRYIQDLITPLTL